MWDSQVQENEWVRVILFPGFKKRKARQKNKESKEFDNAANLGL